MWRKGLSSPLLSSAAHTCTQVVVKAIMHWNDCADKDQQWDVQESVPVCRKVHVLVHPLSSCPHSNLQSVKSQTPV